MRTVNEVSALTGVSVRTLHYYDQIGLLRPSGLTEAGYRLYDAASLARLEQILLFRELEFPLKEIQRILDTPDFDREKALSQQIALLTLKKKRLEALIALAHEMRTGGERKMDFKAFDRSKIDEYAREAKAQWGGTAAYREYEQKTAGQSPAEQASAANGLMALFQEFSPLMNEAPGADAPQRQVARLQAYITEHFYSCTKEILSGLGQMYASGGDFTRNIDRAAGESCAEFVAKAIACYCEQ